MGWGWAKTPPLSSATPRRGVAKLAPPGSARYRRSRNDGCHDVDDLHGTLGSGGAAAAYRRGGLYINGCQCEWHASWWLGKLDSWTHGFFFGASFKGKVNGGLVKQQFWLFFGVILGTLPELFVAVFMLKHSSNAMTLCGGLLDLCSWGYFDLNTNLVADLKVHCSE